jgi:hypothetical protein
LGRKDSKNAICDGIENSNFQNFLLGANHNNASRTSQNQVMNWNNSGGKSNLPPKGKVLATALVMHSYLPNLAGLPICLEISKFFKKYWSKTCNFGMVRWEHFSPLPSSPTFPGKFF